MNKKHSGRWQVVGGRWVVILCLSLLSACDRSGGEAYKKGEELWEAEKYVEAVAQYEKVVSDSPKGHLATDALYQIGNINYLNLRDYSKAIEAYRRLVEMSPESPFSPDAQRKVADIYKDKFGDLKGAVAEYKLFIKVFPKEADKAIYQMARCHVLLKEFGKAREQYEKILKEHPDIDYADDVHYQIANSYYLEGKTGEAIKQFEGLLEGFPDSRFAADARFEIALAKEEDGNLQDALSILELLRGTYHDERVLELRIKGIQERIAAKKRPVPPRVAKRKRSR
ncbi:MAG: tetratricopeptide repeat protein [Deltaproteobacteria bacterium]|nr:tetratricopeptide repeat protein [Deltaproteobacteria bacterium]